MTMSHATKVNLRTGPLLALRLASGQHRCSGMFWNVPSRDGPYPCFSAYFLEHMQPGNKNALFIFIWKIPRPEILLSCKVQEKAST